MPGSVRIAATTDRADNNVDNGIGNPVVDVETFTIGSGEIRTLTFTSPFPGAVAARQNSLPLGPFDSIFNGVYARLITVTTADQFGRPPPPGTELTFFLGDDPLTGYPDTGHGTFDIVGPDGNPEEGGVLFTTPATGSSFVGAAPGCLLFFQGGRPDREGVRIINGVSPGFRQLTVNTPFNTVADLGFSVPYTITCPPTRGNVETAPGAVTVQTDASGSASTVLNYPITQLGRSFCLGAQADGGLAGAVLCGFYLGIADDSLLTLDGQEANLTFSAVVGDMTMQTVTVQLFDGNPVAASPIPAEVLDVFIDIVDPDETDVQLAELEVAAAMARQEAAQDALDEFRETININDGETSESPGVCMDIVDSDGNVTSPQRLLPAICTILMNLEQTVADADQAVRDRQSDLADAQARADQFDLMATFQPASGNPGDPIITGANGLVDIKFTVTDMPPNGLVTFTVTTVGPEFIAPSRQIIFMPTMGDGGAPMN